MTTDRPVNGGNGATRDLDAVIAEYVDRLTAGERLDPVRILSEHPGVGHEILAVLESFVELDEPEDDTPVLSRVGDYALLRRIGRGGMGVVYEAEQLSMDRRVALKVLPAGAAADRNAFLRFLREAQTAGKLHHPNVVAVHGMGVEADTPYYAMLTGQYLETFLPS